MRRLSSPAHLALMVVADAPSMMLEDPVLPAVAELAGPNAEMIIGPAVDAAGGRLHALRCSHVHYVPGAELVVRYRCDITWPDGRKPNDTVLAATNRSGTLPGTIPVVADHEGARLSVSVWRWPFDPVVTGLPVASTRNLLAAALTGLVELPIETHVVAYRPTERAVVRVTDATGRTLYVKVVPPAGVAPLAARHGRILAAGVPVPEVLRADVGNGLLVLAELPGSTLRDRLKAGVRPWPSPTTIVGLMDGIAGIEGVGSSARASRTRDAVAHSMLLETIVPVRIRELESLRHRFSAALDEVAARSDVTIHGDLHEAQFIADDTGTITGLLDIDDLGVGDPVDDPATLLGHLRYRALTSADPCSARAIDCYADELRARVSLRHGAEALDLTTAATLVGLATGPFRLQHPDWIDTSSSVIDLAFSLARGVRA